MKSEEDQSGARSWADDGTLVSETDFVMSRTYFKAGGLKTKSRLAMGTEPSTLQDFSPRGDLVVERIGDEVRYIDDALLESYFSLFEREVPEGVLDQGFDLTESNRLHRPWMWLWQVFDSDVGTYFRLLNSLVIHPNSEVRKNVSTIVAQNSFQKHLAPRNAETEEFYRMIEIQDAYLAQHFPHRKKKIVRD